MGQVLIFGKNSFVASGIDKYIGSNGYEIDFFSRGDEGKTDNVIYGKIENVGSNSYFAQQYDSVINYIVLKDKGVEENIEFIQTLLDFCVKYKVKKLIHFSSIMVYDYREKYVDELTLIESSIKTYKKGYGEIKIAVDEYLQSMKGRYAFEIILVRPGYVLDEIRACPFVKKLPLGIRLIKGNRESKQPIVKKESIHRAILQILTLDKNYPVYHFFPNNDQTKYQFAKENFGGLIIPMPEIIFKVLPFILTKVGVVPKSLYSRFEGMYIKTIFSSKITEQKLNIIF